MCSNFGNKNGYKANCRASHSGHSEGHYDNREVQEVLYQQLKLINRTVKGNFAKAQQGESLKVSTKSGQCLTYYLGIQLHSKLIIWDPAVRVTEASSGGWQLGFDYQQLYGFSKHLLLEMLYLSTEGVERSFLARTVKSFDKVFVTVVQAEIFTGSLGECGGTSEI